MKKKLQHSTHEKKDSMIEKNIEGLIEKASLLDDDLIEFSLAMYTQTEKYL